MPDLGSTLRHRYAFAWPALALAIAVCVRPAPAAAKPKPAKHAAAAAPTASPQNSAPEPNPEPEPPPSAASAKDEPAPPSALKPGREPPPLQPKAAEPTPADDAQLAALRSDVSGLVDDLVEARARAALLGKTLFKTQLRVRVQNLAAPDPVLVKIALKLDGAPIFQGDQSALKGDAASQVFEGFIAPGAHVLSAELEQNSRDDAAYGYSLHETYRFAALRDKRSELTLIVDDDSDLASDFPGSQAGEYDVRIKLRVKTKALNAD
jgi:hypothetical protein